MMKFAVVFALLVTLIVPGASFAAKKQVGTAIDMSKYACSELLAQDSDEMGTILIWIDGYLSGKTGDTTIDTKFLEELATGVGQTCKDSPNSKVLSVVEKLMK